MNEFYWTPGRLTAGAVYALGRDTQKPMPGINRPEPVEQSFVGGIAISPDGRHVYAVHVLGEALTMLDIKSGLVRGTVDGFDSAAIVAALERSVGEFAGHTPFGDDVTILAVNRKAH